MFKGLTVLFQQIRNMSFLKQNHTFLPFTCNNEQHPDITAIMSFTLIFYD